MNVHLGEKLQRAVKEQKFPITLLSQRLHKSRQHIYNLFQNPNIPIETILRIGRIIQYDFTQDLKEISKVPEEYLLEKLTEPEIKMESAMYWKSKYFELLEQHKNLIKKEFEQFFNKTKKPD